MCICVSAHQKPFTRSPPPYVHPSAVSALDAPVWKQKSSHEPQRSQQLSSCILSPDTALTNSRGRGFVTAKACICVSLVKGCQHIKRRTGQAVVTPMGATPDPGPACRSSEPTRLLARHEDEGTRCRAATGRRQTTGVWCSLRRGPCAMGERGTCYMTYAGWVAGYTVHRRR